MHGTKPEKRHWGEPRDSTLTAQSFCIRRPLLCSESLGAHLPARGSVLDTRQSPWLVASVSWRAPRALDRYAGHNEYKIRVTSRIGSNVPTPAQERSAESPIQRRARIARAQQDRCGPDLQLLGQDLR